MLYRHLRWQPTLQQINLNETCCSDAIQDDGQLLRGFMLWCHLMSRGAAKLQGQITRQETCCADAIQDGDGQLPRGSKMLFHHLRWRPDFIKLPD